MTEVAEDMAQYARFLAYNVTFRVKLLMILGKPGGHDAVSNISRLSHWKNNICCSQN